jgi:hypothetical protein
MGKADKAKLKPKRMMRDAKMKMAKKKARKTARKTARKIGVPALLALAAGGAAFKMKKAGGSGWRPFKLTSGAGSNGKAAGARPATPAAGAKAAMDSDAKASAPAAGAKAPEPATGAKAPGPATGAKASAPAGEPAEPTK